MWVFLVFLYHNWFVVANITIIMINQIEYINYFYKFKQYVSFRLYLRFPRQGSWRDRSSYNAYTSQPGAAGGP